MDEIEMPSDLPSIMQWHRNDGAVVRVCPQCWSEHGAIVPIMLEMVGTFSMRLPDDTEVGRLAGAYRFCYRCLWTEQRGILKPSTARRDMAAGEEQP